MNLIGRYIFRETLTSTVIVMAVLLLIFMSSQFADTLGDAAADLLPRDAVFRVFSLQFLQYLALLAPVGLLLGVLLALARLNRDSEMVAMASCGIGPIRLLWPIGALSLTVACGVGWLALMEAPAASRAIEEIRFQAQDEMELGALVPGSFTAIDDGTTIVYAREAEGDFLRGLFIQSETDDRIVLVLAEEGERAVDEITGETGLRLRNGRRYEGEPGNGRWFVAEFREHGLPIRLEETEPEFAIASTATSDLIGSSDAVARAELEWRLAAPLSILVLSLLAVPLGRSSPREGRYARVGLGLLIYIIYANTLSIARIWMEREAVPAWIGTWWVHLVLALLAILMLARQAGVGVRPGTVERHEPTG